MALKIEIGTGWKPDPKEPGRLVTCCPSDYVAEIERLRAACEEVVEWWDTDSTPDKQPDFVAACRAALAE